MNLSGNSFKVQKNVAQEDNDVFDDPTNPEIINSDNSNSIIG